MKSVFGFFILCLFGYVFILSGLKKYSPESTWDAAWCAYIKLT